MDENIRKLDLHEHILTRPNMYIGRNWDADAFHFLVAELCRQAITPEYGNECSTLSVIIQDDTCISIIDDGRGLPVEVIHIKESVARPKIEHIFEWFMKTGTPLPVYYQEFGFLNYLSVVLNNVTSALVVETKFDGRWYRLTCSRGKIIEPLRKLDEVHRKDKGTRLTFTPDPLVFADFKFSFEAILEALTALKHECPSVIFSLEDKRSGQIEVF